MSVNDPEFPEGSRARPCPGQVDGAHAFGSGACVDCGEHNPIAEIIERQTVERIVAWMRTEVIRMCGCAKSALTPHEQRAWNRQASTYHHALEAIKSGKWKDGER